VCGRQGDCFDVVTGTDEPFEDQTQIYAPLALALTKFHILPYDVFVWHVIKLLIQQSTRPVIVREFHCLFTG